MILRLPFSIQTSRRYICIALLLLLITGALALGLGRNQTAQHPDSAISSPPDHYQTNKPGSDVGKNRSAESSQTINPITPASVADGIKPQNNNTVVTGFYKKAQTEEGISGEVRHGDKN